MDMLVIATVFTILGSLLGTLVGAEMAAKAADKAADAAADAIRAKRAVAARKGVETRQRNKRRSAAARKGWLTRRANAEGRARLAKVEQDLRVRGLLEWAEEGVPEEV